MSILTAAALALHFSPAAAVQDDAAKMEWVLQEGDRFDFTWTYNEQRKREPGHGETTETHDKRDVAAELVWKSEGILTLVLKKVNWSYGSQDYEVTLAYTEGKKLDPQLKMKVTEKASGYQVSKADADHMVEYMRTMTDGVFTVDTVTEKGRTLILWNGSSLREPGQLSLLGRIFTHPLLPSGPVRVGQIFKDPLDVTNLTAGLTEIKEVESKVTAVGDKGLIAKGGVNIPVGKSTVASGSTQTMTGNFTYTCEWNYSPQQYLQGSKEESKFTKKVDAKGKEADFYRETFNHSISQTLTIKKKPPAPGEQKKKSAPEEKPGEEKKPAEK
ncbi:MAG TPA: hypothetical protein VMU54_02555 [Planctomycetota bacterium]|nr:hypothetical protein [Planctomycetota bacterium]